MLVPAPEEGREGREGRTVAEVLRLGELDRPLPSLRMSVRHPLPLKLLKQAEVENDDTRERGAPARTPSSDMCSAQINGPA